MGEVPNDPLSERIANITRANASATATVIEEAACEGLPKQLASFHAKNGLYFELIDNGSVRVLTTEKRSISLSAREWQSVTDAMAQRYVSPSRIEALWNAIKADSRLDGVRRKLSLHHLDLIVRHALAGLSPSPDPALERLRELSERATQGEWQLQDGCSWRRIGTREHDGNVLCPSTYSREDRHPDLTAGRGEDLYANLHFIVACVSYVRAALSRAEGGEG